MAGSPGDIERTRLDPRFVALALVVFVDVVEQPGVAAAPGIDRLLHVADLEKAPFFRRVLDGFVDQVRDDVPLHVVGILKLVEQPVVILGIESVVDPEPFLRARHLRQERARVIGAELVAGQDQFHVLEGQPSLPPDQPRVGVLVEIEHLPDSVGTVEAVGQLGTDKVSDDPPEDIAGFAGEFVFLTIDGELEMSRFDLGPIGQQLAEKEIDPPGHRLSRRVGDQVVTKLAPELELFLGDALGVEDLEEPLELHLQVHLNPQPFGAPRPDRLGIAPLFAGGGVQVNLVLVVDEAVENPADGVFFLAEGGQLEGPEKLLLRFAGLVAEGPLENDPVNVFPSDGGEVIVDDLEVSREAELGGKTPEDVGKEAVERAEKQPWHPVDEDPQQPAILDRAELREHRIERIVPVAVECGCPDRIGGGVGELLENLVEKLAGRFPGKRHRHNSLRRYRVARQQLLTHQRDVAVGELPGFPGARRGEDHLVGDRGVHGDIASTGLSSPRKRVGSIAASASPKNRPAKSS